MQQHLLEVIKHGFADHWALVIGDLMLDRYLWGKVERISPEAPVPVVLVDHETECAGGASNVAANLAGLGMKTRLVGYIGDDDNGDRLREVIHGLGIDSQGLLVAEQHPTISKIRILGGHQQMLRLDYEKRTPYSESEMQALVNMACQQLDARPAVVLLSDYAKGVLSETLCQTVIAKANALGIPVLVDPKGRDYSKYRGASALTPNKKEIAEACGADMHDTATLLQKAEQLRQQLHLDFLAVTRGEEGISLLEGAQPYHLAATARQVFDVSGAGDTVIATLAAGLAVGLDRQQALHLANLAAGVVVGKVGTMPIQHHELLHELAISDTQEQADKICNLPDLLTRTARWRATGEKVVFTNGCFDLLHAGHVTYLEQARKLGDKLVLGLNTDRSISALKGPTRPVIHEANRARVMAALEAIDAVILFDDDTPLELIKQVKPDILVKGDDYSEDQVVGGVEVKTWGGRVALIPVVAGLSTSNIIKKLGN